MTEPARPYDLIIFDLGNVLVDINEQKGLSLLDGLVTDDNGFKVSLDRLDSFLFAPDHNGRNPWHAMQHGIDMSCAVPSLVQDRAGPNVSKELLEDSVCDIFTLMPERMRLFHAMIEEQKMDIVLLSDTPPLHIQVIEAQIPDLLAPLSIDKLFFSYDIGAMKKFGREAYDHVIQKRHANPKRTLMIDDSIGNKPGCAAAGIDFAHVSKEQDLISVLRDNWNVPVPKKLPPLNTQIFLYSRRS